MSLRQTESPWKTWWTVAGCPGEEPRAGELGFCLGYERVGEKDLVALRFADGSKDRFTPWQLFPAAPPSGSQLVLPLVAS